MVKELVGFNGQLLFNIDKPDGTPRKLLDVSKIHKLGWQHRLDLKEGIQSVLAELEKTGWNFDRK